MVKIFGRQIGGKKKKPEPAAAPTPPAPTPQPAPTVPKAEVPSKAREQRIAEGSAYIREREKLANKLGSKKEAAVQLSKESKGEFTEKLVQEEVKSQERVDLAAEPPPQNIDPTLETGQVSPLINIPSIQRSAAQLVDAAQSVYAGKTLRQKNAEQSFVDLSSAISQEVDLVRAGARNPIEVQASIDQAVEAINQLESTTHGLGKLNKGYLIDDGLSIESQILREKRTLEAQRQELLLAVQEGRLSRARALVETEQV